MLEFKDVSFRYPGGPVIIPGLSFKIEKGEFVALAGSNGAGKSTISRLSNGLLLPTAGEVTVGGFNTNATRASKIARKAGFLFQNPDRQICQNTTREEIAFGMRVQGLPEEEVAARTEEALKTFGLDGDRSPFTRSRGNGSGLRWQASSSGSRNWSSATSRRPASTTRNAPRLWSISRN